MQTLKRILSPLSSLRLTVVLLILSMILIFAGTTVQTEMGIWDVQRYYFHSWFTIIHWRLFFPLWNWGSKNIPGAIPFPGGYTLIALLLINLLAAHTVRFKINWKRSGILLIHAGLIFLLIGEIVTATTAVETQMTIDEGSSANWTQDIREIELAITDRSDPQQDKEIVVPLAMIHQGQTLERADLPFSLQFDAFFPNSDIAGPMQTNVPNAVQLATAGVGKELRLIPLAPVAGTDSRVNAPSAFVTLKGAAGGSLGTYLVSTMQLLPQFPQIDRPQVVEVDGNQYWLQLRFRRYYKPYTFYLKDFAHDRFTGTDMPRNFSSLVRVVDPARNVDREVLIWMNHPLRFAGETFYQASFKPGDTTTILQVVHNPGWLIPYISCSMVGLGLLVHFGMHLLTFLRRRGAPAAERPRATPATSLAGTNGNGKHGNGAAVAVLERTTTTLPPPTRPKVRVALWPAVTITALCALYVVTTALREPPGSGMGMNQFARVPVMYEGRVMPMDSLARNSLRILSNRAELATASGTQPAVNWLLNLMSNPRQTVDEKVFRIDNPEVLNLLKLDDNRKLFSRGEIDANLPLLEQQYQLARRVEAKERDLYQRKVIELGQHVILFNQLANLTPLYLSPPLAGATEWKTFGEVIDGVENKTRRDPGVESFVAMLQAAAMKDYVSFNTVATEYNRLIDKQMPEVASKLRLEVLFNRAEPFIQCMALYVIAFVLAAVSWLKWGGPLGRAALWVLVLALVLHTLGLATRIYLQGRPPVTNLYSSAIFIAWAAALFCVFMELIYRNGIAVAAASAMAFPSLLIAHYLAGAGDTMKMLEAVLDTNIWLATHVVVVTLGYTATFLAGFIAIGAVIASLVKKVDPEMRKTLYRMVYGVVCFAVLFSFVGTILGGIWADQSWGRFWGWDPKENGAVLIVLWNAILLHARWGGLVRERGFMLMAVGGNIVTAWSWFGTNMLGVGLHSYGFMDSALVALLSFVALQLIIIGVGLLPTAFWSNARRATAAAGA
jgi:ABC-type transport system involved in cytochrome c biogenesis permease subunit